MNGWSVEAGAARCGRAPRIVSTPLLNINMNPKQVLVLGAGAYGGWYVYTNFVAGKISFGGQIGEIALMIVCMGAGAAALNKMV